MATKTLLLALCTLYMAGCVSAQFQFDFGNMFDQGDDGGGHFGGGGGQEEDTGAPEPVPKGYLCPDTETLVDNPRQCPCPGHKVSKCKLDDWYVCVPAGTKCPEGKFKQLSDNVPDIDEDE
eukprot:m.37773 g.37773  ORF g.37773 m.37773 type:complete len:121 (-) comp9350_c1_seq1:1897-2259(-)